MLSVIPLNSLPFCDPKIIYYCSILALSRRHTMPATYVIVNFLVVTLKVKRDGWCYFYVFYLTHSPQIILQHLVSVEKISETLNFFPLWSLHNLMCVSCYGTFSSGWPVSPQPRVVRGYCIRQNSPRRMIPIFQMHLFSARAFPLVRTSLPP